MNSMGKQCTICHKVIPLGKATKKELGLLINFGEASLKVKRIIWTEKFKKK